MAGFLIAVLLSLGVGGERRVYVDLVEVNTFSQEGQRQLILWRWHSQQPVRGFRVAQWWVISGDDTLIVRHGGYWKVRSRGVTLFTRSIRETDTRGKIDPEVRDRDVIPAELRVGYVPSPGWSIPENP